MARPGTFGKGNKLGKGRPKKAERETVQAMAREHTEEMLQIILKVARSSEDDNARVRAANLIIERGWGKVPQPVEGVSGGEPIEIRWLAEPPAPAADAR